MAGAAKVPAALADIIVTCSLCYSLGYVRTGVRACVWSPFRREAIVLTLENHLFQDGLGTQGSDKICDPTRRFGDCGPDRAPDCVLCVQLTHVLVCRTGRCLFAARSDNDTD